MVGVCVMDTGYEGAAVWCDFTDKLFGRTAVPDCRLLGGMRAFRAIKVRLRGLLVRQPVRRVRRWPTTAPR